MCWEFIKTEEEVVRQLPYIFFFQTMLIMKYQLGCVPPKGWRYCSN